MAVGGGPFASTGLAVSRPPPPHNPESHQRNFTATACPHPNPQRSSSEVMSSVITAAIGAPAALARIFLSPIFSGPLLFSITFYPDAVRSAIGFVADKLLPHQLATTFLHYASPLLLSSSTTVTVLQAAVVLGVLRRANQMLNTMASNSWRFGPAPGWDWPNEIAVVTGGSSGIGKGIVQRLSALGVRVVVLDVQKPPADLSVNPRVSFYRCDVTSSQSVAAAAAAIRSDIGQPSILVNNAGIANPMPILQTQEAFLRKIMGVNLMSMWFTTQQFLPDMIKQDKGHVMTMASIASFVALPTAADYSATKAGALAFHESLTSELKHQYKAPNVLTSIVHPHFVRTPLLEGISARLEKAGVQLLTSELIAEEAVELIKSRRGGQLVIPGSVAAVSGIRGWPTWLQELVRDTVGKTTAGL